MRFVSVFVPLLLLVHLFALPAPSFASEAIAKSLCGAIISDDRQHLRATLSNNKLRLRNIFTSVRCNGYSMLQFAITAEALEVGDMLIRQLPVSLIEADQVNGQSVTEWAVNAGYGSSPVLDAVRERLSD